MKIYQKLSVIVAVVALTFALTGTSFSNDGKDAPRYGQWVTYDCVVTEPIHETYDLCVSGGNGECVIGMKSGDCDQGIY